jgi:hypothetical protein
MSLGFALPSSESVTQSVVECKPLFSSPESAWLFCPLLSVHNAGRERGSW